MKVTVKTVRPPTPETAALLAVDHPNIVRLLDVRDRELVLEEAPGGSLHDLLAGRGRLAPGEVVTIGGAVADALAELHRRGLVHGDVHPGNILFGVAMTPLLADFGAVAAVGARSAGQGARGFTAPEVERGEPSSPASDQWSLASVCRAALGPLLPTPLAVVLSVALSAEPADRFGSIAAMATALRHAGAPAAVEPARTPANAAAPPVTRRYGPRPPVARRLRARRGPSALAMTAIACAAVVGGVAVAHVFTPSVVPAATPARNASPTCATLPPPPTLPGDRIVQGCSVVAVQRGDELRVTLNGVDHRYRIGQPGDVVLLGDFDCDGVETPAVHRSSTGRVLVFGTWEATAAGVGPVATAQLEPGREAQVSRAAAADGCDAVSVVD